MIRNFISTTARTTIALLLAIGTLHARPAIPEIEDSDRAAFMRAAKCGNIACLSKLTAAGIDINTRDKKGYSPLMHAVLSEHHNAQQTINFLLANGANPSLDAYDGSTPLHNAFHLGRLDLATTIFHAIIATKKNYATQFKPSIAMLIADLKLGPDGAVTILELGEGSLSYFKGHDALYPKGLVWQRFWEYLANKNLPVWYVGNLSTAGREAAEISLPGLKNNGIVMYPSLHILEKDPTFKKTVAHAQNQAPLKLSSSRRPNGLLRMSDIEKKDEYLITNSTFPAHPEEQPKLHLEGHERNENTPTGIVLLRHHTTNQAMLNYFKTTYPTIIVVNEVTRSFVNSKFMTNLLFENDDQLSCFRPQYKTYAKGYTTELVKTIQNDFAHHERVVIKPLDASNGWGVIITPLRHVARELEKIFGNTTPLKKMDDVSYSYWPHDTNRHFIVESFAQSKIIAVNKKKFDATMRQVFVIENGPAGISTTFLASYWKLPALGINEAGTTTERHKSNVKASSKPSTIVAPEDNAVVQEALRFIAPRIYTRMMMCG